MSASFMLSAAAEADLREIIRYTRKQWSDAQAKSYVSTLQRAMRHLATGQGVFRDMTALYPNLRMARCEHHYIFCLPRDGRPPWWSRSFTSEWI